jgi:UDP-N-acetylglucosamine--N-acetylmuramyl-(pentapeptide) pyrophosphoryl-undecaprenol N-acetylglucosamine transferase
MIRVIISGGGTGGHIFPAIAIARALTVLEKDTDILFIGAKGRMEMEKVPAAGFRIEGLNISGFKRKLTLRNLVVPFKLAASLLKARRLIGRFGPDVVVGVGGYASGPALRMAASMGIPTLIQEQNSFPGMTNRLLAEKVTKICVAYEGMERYFPADKVIFTGNPIRQDLSDLRDKKEEALHFFGLQTGLKVVLVMGGSLGARSINQAILKFVTTPVNEPLTAGDALPGIQILWQTGKNYYDTVTKSIKEAGYTIPGVKIFPFIDRMDLAYAVADLVVSRAGAIAISELCVVGKPAILIPSPNVAEDHQTKNATTLSDRRAALLIRDAEAAHQLGGLIVSVAGDPALQRELAGNMASLGITDAADKIAREILGLAHPSRDHINPANKDLKEA